MNFVIFSNKIKRPEKIPPKIYFWYLVTKFVTYSNKLKGKKK